MPHPLHASGFVIDASSRFPGESDRHHFYYQLVCHQDARCFRLLKGNKQTVKAICARCGNEIIVYDLSYYPAASKNPGTEQFTSIRHPSGDESSLVYVMYEYGELDEEEV